MKRFTLITVTLAILLGLLLVPTTAQMQRRLHPQPGVVNGSACPLEISPQLASVPTASSLAIQDNSTSGDVVVIQSTPAANGATRLLYVNADGSNWDGGTYAVQINTDDSSVIPFAVQYQESEVAIIYRTGAALFSGDVTLAGGGSLLSTGSGDITIQPGTTGDLIMLGVPNVVGDAGSTSHGLAANDDLFISGKLEVDGLTYFDSGVELISYATCDNLLISTDGTALGNTCGRLLPATGHSGALQLTLSNGVNTLIFAEDGDRIKDFDHTNQTNPTMYIHSAIDPDTDNTQWLSLAHDQTNGVLATGTGNVRFDAMVDLAAGHVLDVNNVTADLVTFDDHGIHIIDSSGAAVTGTLAAGTSTGQVVKFSCKTAGNNIDITVANHVTSDPEVIRLDTALEWVTLCWDGTDWVEIDGNGQTYP